MVNKLAWSLRLCNYQGNGVCQSKQNAFKKHLFINVLGMRNKKFNLGFTANWQLINFKNQLCGNLCHWQNQQNNKITWRHISGVFYCHCLSQHMWINVVFKSYFDKLCLLFPHSYGQIWLRCRIITTNHWELNLPGYQMILLNFSVFFFNE